MLTIKLFFYKLVFMLENPQVAGLGTTREVELPLSNYKSTIFFYVQRLLQLSCSGTVKTDKLRRIWEPTYT